MLSPRRHTILCRAVVASALLAVAGCGQTAATAAPAPAEAAAQAIPEGVAAQYRQVNDEIKAEGGETIIGEWRIGYIVEPAEAWHQVMNGQHAYRDVATGETHHIEIVPFEAKTGRIVPDVPVRLQVLDAAGRIVDDKQLTFYYGEFFHYANNFAIPTSGRYTLRAQVEPPTFPRHGEQNEQPPLTQGATVEFRDVELTH